MDNYKNLGGNSSVIGFQIDSDYILVFFNDGTKYLYTYNSAGSHHVEAMKELARKGVGLNHYIMTYVKDKFAK